MPTSQHLRLEKQQKSQRNAPNCGACDSDTAALRTVFHDGKLWGTEGKEEGGGGREGGRSDTAVYKQRELSSIYKYIKSHLISSTVFAQKSSLKV